MAACYEELGFAVEFVPGDPTSYHIDAGALDDEVMAERMAECQEKVGEWVPPEGYVEELYEHAKRQRECLSDLGYSLDDPPSFEVYAENLDWDPLGEVTASVGLRGQEFLEVRDQCPYFHQWEEQQQSDGGE